MAPLGCQHQRSPGPLVTGGGTVEYVKWVGKALIAALIAFLGALIAGYQATTPHVIDGGTWLTAALAAVVAIGSVFGYTNGPKPTGKL